MESERKLEYGGPETRNIKLQMNKEKVNLVSLELESKSVEEVKNSKAEEMETENSEEIDCDAEEKNTVHLILTGSGAV